MTESEYRLTIKNRFELWLFDRLRVTYHGMDLVTKLAQDIDAREKTSPLSVVVVANHSSDIDTLLLLKPIEKFSSNNKKIFVSHRFDSEFYKDWLNSEEKTRYAQYLQAFINDPKNRVLMNKYPFFKQAVARYGLETVPIPQADYINQTPLGSKNAKIAYLQLRKVVTEFEHQPSVLIVYPEGTRSPNGVLQPATTVLEAISRYSKRHVVLPVTIFGSHAVLGRDQAIPNFFHAIRVVVSKPIDPQDYYRSGGSNLTEHVMRIIASELPDNQKGIYSEFPGGGW